MPGRAVRRGPHRAVADEQHRPPAADQAAADGGAIEGQVGAEQDLVVPGQQEVDLAAGGAGGFGGAQRCERVLGRADAMAAMAADVDEAVLGGEQTHGRGLW